MSTVTELIDTLALPLFFLLLPFIYLRLKGMRLQKALQYLYVNKADFAGWKGKLSTASNAFALLVAMLALTTLETVILDSFGLLDLDKVSGLLLRQPPFVLLIAVMLSPIAEEIFYRGLLQRRLGVFLSAFLFGASHALYGSGAEILGALTLGLLLSLYVARKKSIAAPIFAYMLYNEVAVLSLTGA